MATAIRERGPVTVAESEREALREVEQLIQRLTTTRIGIPALVGPDGETVELPESVFDLLRQVVQDLSEGRMVTIVPTNQELTTQEAADLLNVSRPYLIKLLEQGEIPFRKVGTHRRVRFVDVMDYRGRRDAQRRQGLDELTQLSREMGLYDE